MNLQRLSQSLGSSLVAYSLFLVCFVSTAEAFLQIAPLVSTSIALTEAGYHPSTTVLSVRANNSKKSSRDRYSSRTVDGSHVADHVQTLYSNESIYRKTIRKAKRVSEQQQSTTSDTSSKATIPINKLLVQLNRYPALILNADYQPMSYLPLSVCHWQEAIKSIFSGKVTVVDVYEGVTIRAATLEIPLPSVIALNEYVPHCNHRPAFTRRNVFLRDEYICQYCSQPFQTKDLSLDHVLPRSMGGHLNWENAVTSCLKCNGRKGNMLVRDLKSVGMKLHAEPHTPTRHELAIKAGKMLPRRVHPTWQPYLGFASETSTATTPDAGLEALGIFDDEDNQKFTTKRKRTSKNQRRRAKKAKRMVQQV